MTAYRVPERFPALKVYPDGTIIGPRGRALSQFPTKDGYLKVRALPVGGSVFLNVSVHVIVCEAFHGLRPRTDSQVRHLDGNLKNNRADNVRWGTKAENEADKITHGTALQGERHHSSKLTEQSVLEIRSRHAAGEMQKDLALAYGVSRASIWAVVRRHHWGHVS